MPRMLLVKKEHANVILVLLVMERHCVKVSLLNIKKVRAVPFKSTWEGGCHFFYFSVGCGGETRFFFMLGGVYFLLWGGGV